MSPADAWRAEEPARLPDNADIGIAAFEFLRRNPAYHHDFDQIARRKNPDRKEEAVTAQRWGLRFPGRSIPAGT
ncbi:MULTISPECIES: transcriptional regulator domain-containing protein [Sphingomonadales]|uniref:transcriptional regulator domain-containing protein n=1 Tax=Sphingomonadales TaxID=204457 RepID=UPI00344E339E